MVLLVSLIGDGEILEGGALLFEVPLPRRMAVRPVEWMVERMREGGAEPVVETVWVGREAVMVVMPEWVRVSLGGFWWCGCLGFLGGEVLGGRCTGDFTQCG